MQTDNSYSFPLFAVHGSMPGEGRYELMIFAGELSADPGQPVSLCLALAGRKCCQNIF